MSTTTPSSELCCANNMCSVDCGPASHVICVLATWCNSLASHETFSRAGWHLDNLGLGITENKTYL